GIIAKSILSLAKYSKSRVILTGTPLPNGFEDLQNLYKYIWPTKNIIKFYPFQLKQMGSSLHDSRISELMNNISPYYVRIKKSDLGIPTPIEHSPIKVKMGKEQRRIYDFIENKYIASINGDNQQGTFRNQLTKAKLIRLMQVATNPSLLNKPLEEYYKDKGFSDNIMIDDSEILSKISQYTKNEIPAKFEYLLELIKPMVESGKKIIIWTTFVKNITDLEIFLSNYGISSKAIYGEIPVDSDDDFDVETREKIINEFHKENSSFKVLLANPFSVSESISLHKACHIAVYLERTFNAGHFIQSKDRIHRYGLNADSVTEYYYMTCEDSIDETIHERLKFKERRMNEAIEKNPIPLFFNALDEDFANQDIKAIIKDYVKRNN
ncbi:MAG: DEAD/DEAH box helicase, partial [Lutibacter sp.]|nr:DEAD/DEAH box helicase [Lutibacter sp.]